MDSELIPVDVEVDSELTTVSFDVVAGPDGAARFQVNGKPYAPEELAARVESLARSVRLRRRAERAEALLAAIQEEMVNEKVRVEARAHPGPHTPVSTRCRSPV